MLKKCFGLISWFPDKEPDRQLRIDRLNRLLKQLNELWPTIDILIIAQNWKDFSPNEITNKITAIKFEQGLGILQARKILRQEFLKLDYDYIIMFDDDAIIQTASATAADDYMQTVDEHRDGFCFIHAKRIENAYLPYAAAQLNLCAISKHIYELEDIPDVDPQKSEAYEDGIYAGLLHYKYSKYEFTPPATIYCIQFNNKREAAPSTWCHEPTINYRNMQRNYNMILRFISEQHELPNLKWFFKYGVLALKTAKREDYSSSLTPQHEAVDTDRADGSKDHTYLYF